jgi:hypothetical protein
MASFESPVKLDPSNPKKKRENISWDKYIVNQRVFTRIRSITRWMINNLHVGRIYVFEASQFLNHFLKNGIFALVIS